MRIPSHNAPRDSIGVWNFLETAEDRKIPSIYDRGLLSPLCWSEAYTLSNFQNVKDSMFA